MIHKALVAKREEIIRDINRIAWAKNKRLIIDSIGRVEQTTIEATYSDILRRINFEAYKATRKHVVEAPAGIKSANISISYSDAIKEADRISWRIASLPIAPEQKDKGSNTLSILYDNIKSNADKVSWKVANCRIVEQEARAEAQMDDTYSSLGVFRNGYIAAISNIYRELYFCIAPKNIADADHTFTFDFSEDWNGNINVIKALIYQYIETYTLYEWFKVTMPNEAATYLAEADRIMQSLREEAKSDYNNESWLLSTWNRRVGELNDMLRLYISSEASTSDGYAAFSLTFVTPWMGSTSALTSYMQRYIVDGILRDWFALVMPNTSYASDKEDYSGLILQELASEENADQWCHDTAKSAADKVGGMLRPYITDTTFDDEGWVYTLSFPKGWGGSTEAMSQYVTDYMCDYILQRFFSLEAPERAAAYDARIQIHKDNIISEAISEIENYDWFERQVQTAVDHLKGSLRWCIREHTGTIVDNTIKRKTITYGDEELPEVEQDPTSFGDDMESLGSPAEIEVTIPEYTFRFAFSPTWRGNFESLGNYIHRYIVDYILFEWFKMTLPNEASTYLASATEWERKIINEARSEDVSNVYFRL